MEHADPVKLFTAIGAMLAIVLTGSALSHFWPQPWKRWFPQFFMSNGSINLPPKEAVVAPVVQRSTSGGQLIATTDNEGNAELSDNAVVQVVVPEEARDIIRFQAQVETLATLIKAGIVSNKATGIEKTFGCSRSSKPDSTYQKVLKLLDPMLNEGPKFRELDDDGKPVLTHTA
jgi:hypothetical protein